MNKFMIMCVCVCVCVCVVVVELRTAAEDRERMKEVEEAVAREVQRNLIAVQAKNVQVSPHTLLLAPAV